jgi:hypothetical protein
VPDPFDGQAFNRYSYVYNNPLSFIDPSGFDPTTGNGFSRPDDASEPDIGVPGHCDFAPRTICGGGPPAYLTQPIPVEYERGESVVRRFWFPRPHVPRPRLNDALTGTAFGLAARYTGLAARYTGLGTEYLVDQEPPGLAKLRQTPEWRRHEDELWEKSLARGPFGSVRKAVEHGMLVFRDRGGRGRQPMIFQPFSADPDKPSSIRGSIVIPEGYELVAIYHTHPFAYGGTGLIGRSYLPGPSEGKPGPFRALGHWTQPYPYETYYYGAMAGSQ